MSRDFHTLVALFVGSLTLVLDVEVSVFVPATDISANQAALLASNNTSISELPATNNIDYASEQQCELGLMSVSKTPDKNSPEISSAQCSKHQ